MFPVRGTLPWHNFLSGPTAWNEEDYRQYLVGQARMSGGFQALYEKESPLFGETGDDDAKFTGVWSLAYIRQAHAYIRQRAPKVKIAISGWGGGAQLPAIMQGLDKVLPKDIVFTCLNQKLWLQYRELRDFLGTQQQP